METEFPQVVFENAENLTSSSKKVVDKSGIKHVTKISFEVEASPQAVARLLYFARQKPPLNIIVQSPQAEFDLHMTPVNVATGEIASGELPGYLK